MLLTGRERCGFDGGKRFVIFTGLILAMHGSACFTIVKAAAEDSLRHASASRLRLRSTPHTPEDLAILERIHAKRDAARKEALKRPPPDADVRAREREQLRAATAEPPIGLSEQARKLFLLRRHIEVLEDVLRWAAEPAESRCVPYVLLGRLAACGHPLPLAIEPRPFVLLLSKRDLRALKRLSVRGNIAAAIVLTAWYSSRSWWLHGVPARTRHNPLMMLQTLPERIGVDARSRAYAKRARNWARRRLRTLRRDLARLARGEAGPRIDGS